ncbi:3-hydroxyisobutyrate dehydrogenase [Azorhizobium oxalatiphilum]|uniref:3-hydroxyisobutyrate dehydrogenase n=1 Tax=Azorhizobium oxalatiphilum TaxID=980631 RepID=A0A917BV05_9HYPH|nr:3-hydroxyisobutyrate dehydrogenase [Azorhizobium oxalatiphilum]
MATVGVIGLGNMGRGMALSLKRAGVAVLGYDAMPETRGALAAEGVDIAADLATLCASAELVVLSLPTAAIVEEVVAGPDGLLEHAKPGLLVVDTSTSHPDTTRKLAKALEAKGMAMIDAPVSGGPKGAITATMTMVIGGSDADVARAMPTLEAMSATRVHVGPVGAGHVTKIINNLLCAAHLLTTAEALRLAQESGVEPARMLEGINAGSGRSGVSQVNAPTWILNGAFNSGFTMKLMRKDVKLGTDLLSGLGLEMPMFAAAADIWADSAASIADGEDFNRIVETQFSPAKKG